MSDFRLTDAHKGDVVALAKFIGDWVRETGWMPVLHTRTEDEDFVAALLASHAVRVARGGSQPLGFLARQEGRIQALHVASGARGQGIGRALLDEVKAVEPEISLWTFQANTRAIAFYTGAGFVEAERTDGAATDEGLPDLRMIWSRQK